MVERLDYLPEVVVKEFNTDKFVVLLVPMACDNVGCNTLILLLVSDILRAGLGFEFCDMALLTENKIKSNKRAKSNESTGL